MADSGSRGLTMEVKKINSSALNRKCLMIQTTNRWRCEDPRQLLKLLQEGAFILIIDSCLRNTTTFSS